MDIKRRRHLTSPGDTLLLAKSPLENAVRFTEWRDATGLHPNRIRPGTLCSVPLPVYTAPVPGKRQFAEVKPEALWHPLFWLPARLAGRYNLPTVDGGHQTETDDMWSIRVSLELTASGLYDPQDGWIDILSTVGIDVENEADLARLQEWQEGGVDDLLDSIDLTGYLHIESNPDWALHSAIALHDTLFRAQWALLANSLIEMLQEATDPAEEITLDEVAHTTSVVASLAEVQLGNIPAEPGEDLPAHFWQRVLQQSRSGHWLGTTDFVAGPVAEAFDWLYAKRDVYWASLDELRTLQQA